MRRKAPSISMCHSHHESCQLLAHTMTTIASARKANASANAKTKRSCRFRWIRRNPNEATPKRPTPMAARMSCHPSSCSSASGSSSGGSSASEKTAQTTTRPPGLRGVSRAARITASARSRAQLRGGADCEEACDDEPERASRARTPSSFLEQHAGRREGVQAEEARARDEGERDEKEPGIATSARSALTPQPIAVATAAAPEHEPEVGGMVLPALVDLRAREQRDEKGEWRCDDREPDSGAHHLQGTTSRVYPHPP